MFLLLILTTFAQASELPKQPLKDAVCNVVLLPGASADIVKKLADEQKFHGCKK